MGEDSEYIFFFNFLIKIWLNWYSDEVMDYLVKHRKVRIVASLLKQPSALIDCHIGHTTL